MPTLLHRPIARSLLVALLLAVCASRGPRNNALAAPEAPIENSLAVSFNRQGALFAPHETARLIVTVTSVPAGESRDSIGRRALPRLEWQLVPVGGTKPVASGDVQIQPAGAENATDVTLEITMPHAEGVYTLRLAAFGRRVPRAERSVQVVVIDNQRRRDSEPDRLANRLVDAFDPAAGGLFRKVALDASGKKLDSPLARLLKFSRPAGESKAVALSDLSAVAYRLKVPHPGRPHLVEIHCPANREQRGSVCLVEGDALGQFLPLGAECSFVAGSPAVRNSRGKVNADDTHVHRQIFWPNDHEPALVAISSAGGRPLEISRVQLYELGEHLPVAAIASEDLDAGGAAGLWKPRLVGPYLNLHELPRNFCGPRPADPDSSDDWQTYTLAGRRLTEYLRYRRQNALLLALPADVTMEISNQIAGGEVQSPRRNPSSQDALELLLRLFDREGLVLIPELRFDCPFELLPAREKYDALNLVDREGHVPSASKLESAGETPAWNPFSERVQQTVEGVAAEFLKRFSGHPSFGGVAFRLGRRSCLQLPGLEWGYDAASIRRFEQAVQVQVPRAESADATAAAWRFLTTTARRDWVRFRAAEIASFHRRLVDQVLAAQSDARVIFTGHVVLSDDSEPAAALVETIRSGISPARSLAEQGLDFSLPPYATDSHVTVLRPVVQLDHHDPTLQAAAASLNLSAAIDLLYRGACPGGLLQPLRRKQHPPLFEAADGSSPGLEPVITVSAEAQQAADAQYTQLLAGLDAQIFFEGAGTTALVPAGNEPRLPQVISQLPFAAFKPAGPQIQPVVVRSAQLGSSTWLYAVNGSSLPVAVELILDCPATTAARLLTDADSTSLQAAPGKGSRVRFELAGNGLWAAELESAGASVSETQVTFADDVLAEMKQRIDRLQTNMKSAAQSRPRLSPEPRAQAKEPRGALQAAAWETTVRQADSFDGDEVRQLTKTVSSVKLAWEEGRYADCQRMLEGYWSQLLLSVPAESPPASSPRPKMTERLRDRLKR